MKKRDRVDVPEESPTKRPKLVQLGEEDIMEMTRSDWYTTIVRCQVFFFHFVDSIANKLIRFILRLTGAKGQLGNQMLHFFQSSPTCNTRRQWPQGGRRWMINGT